MKSETTQSRQRQVQTAKVRSPADTNKRKTLAFRFTGDSGAEIARLTLDERQSSLLKRVAAATGLTWDELFAFILDHQLEVFFPAGDDDVFSVRQHACPEISTNLAKAERAITALRATAEEMAFSLDLFREKQPFPACGFLAELPGLFSLIGRLSGSADMAIADARAHWTLSARPVLLESRIAPPLIERVNARAA